MFGKKGKKEHPEALEGEVLLTNADSEGLDHIGWKSKRRGNVAYDIHNKPIKSHDFFPVFVQRQELLKGGIDPDGLWKGYGKKFNTLPFILIALVVLALLAVVVTQWPW